MTIRCCNACDWIGPESETVMLSDHRGGGVGPLCPECYETTEVDDYMEKGAEIAELRQIIVDSLYMLDERRIPEDAPVDSLRYIPYEIASKIGGLTGVIGRLETDNEHLRKLLALARCGPTLYTDDGELSDCSVFPHIDFKRDTPAEIEEKIKERNSWANP